MVILGWIGFMFLLGFIIGIVVHGSMIKDYAEKHRAYTIDGEIYYIVKAGE